MKLAIILVNYNTPGDTIECLESIKKAKIPKDLKIETTLVDNASVDDSVNIFKNKYPEVKLIENRINLGFAGGNNVGIKEALKENPTHVLLLNNDTLVDKNFFVDLTTSAINEKNVGILSPLIYFATGYEFKKNYQKKDLGKVIWYGGGIMDWDNVLGSHAHVDEVDSGELSPVDTDFATGACMLIKKQVLDQIGFLNEDYFLYLEDLEFCHRAKLKGWRIIFDPSPKIWHKVSQSSGIGSSLNDYFITRNRLQFGLKYAKTRTKFALIREAIRKLLTGTPTQKSAITDYFFGNLGRGSWGSGRS